MKTESCFKSEGSICQDATQGTELVWIKPKTHIDPCDEMLPAHIRTTDGHSKSLITNNYHMTMKLQLKKAYFNDFRTAYGWCENEIEVQNWAGNQIQVNMDGQALETYWQNSVVVIKDKIPLAAFTDSDKLIGYVELSDINSNHKSARIEKFIIGPSSFRGRGYGTSFLEMLIDYIFDDLEFHRIDLLVIERNTGAERLYRKMGFEVEGIMRDARLYANRFFNIKIMSLIEKSENDDLSTSE